MRLIKGIFSLIVAVLYIFFGLIKIGCYVAMGGYICFSVYNMYSLFKSESMLSIVGNAVIFIVIWFILKCVLDLIILIVDMPINDLAYRSSIAFWIHNNIINLQDSFTDKDKVAREFGYKNFQDMKLKELGYYDK